MNRQTTDSTTVIVLGGTHGDSTGFIPGLARIGTLPAVLRIVLSAKDLKVDRTILCVDSISAPLIKRELRQTGRLPSSLEWYEYAEEPDLANLICHVGTSGNVIFVLADRTYQPALLKKASEWKKSSGALTFCSGSELVGVYVLSRSAARELAEDCDHEVRTLEALHEWVQSKSSVEVAEVEDQAWQKISCPADRLTAEDKLNKWLVKPTDGRFAQMNRRVSIPISRWLLRWPVTPNMVTLFTLGVSFAAGLCLAQGGYWPVLLGAVLSVWASILDGCDGEVARLKLQVSDFGCWLETVCDYLYYVFVFGGMIIGFSRTIGTRFALIWGPLLFVGAVTSFLAVGFARHHFAAERPEAFLSIWQKKAENRKSNPLLFVGRQCEFLIRRCFLPYAFLAFALFNILPVAFVLSAIGANIVWPIALYSCFALSKRRALRSSGSPATASPNRRPAIA